MKKLLISLGLLICILISGCGNEIECKNIKQAQLGEYTKYGYYNGEPIIWKVVDVNGSHKKLLSWYVLDVKSFNEKDNRKADWENCSTRKWLNDSFMAEAFSLKEQKSLLYVERKKNVYDKVFLLNKDELELYFDGIEDRRCQVTQYLKKRKEYNEHRDNTYWLDTAYTNASMVRAYGQECYWNYYVDHKGRIEHFLVWSPLIEFIAQCGIRPVILVDVNK